MAALGRMGAIALRARMAPRWNDRGFGLDRHSRVAVRHHADARAKSIFISASGKGSYVF
jgi:hypothetical protein